MKRFYPTVFLLMLSVAADAQSPSVLLQKAIWTENSAGSLETAIELYQQVIASEPPRSQAAQARFRLASAFLKTGRSVEAAGFFREVVLHYPEEELLVARASHQLAALSTPANAPAALQSGRPRFSILRDRTMTSQSTTEFEMSPDGEQMLFIAPWPNPEAGGPWQGVGIRNGMANVGVYVSDRAGTQVRPLIRDWGKTRPDVPPPGERGSMQWIGGFEWSPDGRQILFGVSQVSDSYNGDLRTVPRGEAPEERRRAYEMALYLVDPEGGTPRQLGSAFDPGRRDLGEIGWTPDSRHLAYYRYSDQTVYHRSMDGTDRAAARVPITGFGSSWQFSVAVSFGGYSPDGKWLVFSRRRALSDPERDLWLVPAGGGEARRLNSDPNLCRISPLPLNNRASQPAWSRDGTALYFHHEDNVWKQSFDTQTGRLTGEAEPVTFYDDAEVNEFHVVGESDALVYSLSKTRTMLLLANSDEPGRIFNLGRGRSPQISPDGRTVFFRGEGPGQQGIFRIDRTGENRRRLTEAGIAPREVVETPPFSLSPDGSMLSFLADGGSGRSLYVMPTAGGTPRELAQVASSRTVGARWSPDSRRIAFVSGKELFTVPASGGPVSRVGQLQGWYYAQALWSPDGSLLAAVGGEDPDYDGASVFVFPSEGGEPRLLASSKGEIECLAWHPSGDWLSFFDYRDTRHHRVDLQGRVSGPLFDHAPSWEYCGAWAPDGRRFYFSGAVEQGTWRLFSYDIVSSRFEDFDRASDDVVGQSSPVWSRDGKTILWTNTSMQSQIWLMEIQR